MDELFTVGCIQLASDCALKGLGGAGAIQGVRPTDDDVPTGK